MNYFLDTEFLEGKQDKRFLGIKYGETKPTIDLISIGIVSEDGREYYAISKDFNLYEAWNRYQYTKFGKEDKHKVKEYWIRENVLKPIFEEFLNPVMDSKDNNLRVFNYKNFKTLVNKYGKSNKQIAEDVYDFCITYDTKKSVEENNPKLYGYYSAYDHVALCWLFGKMIDLPKGFPMYTIDLKQMMDEHVWKWKKEIDNNGGKSLPFDYALEFIKCNKNYPKQENEHNALADAKWNKYLYFFLNEQI